MIDLEVSFLNSENVESFTRSVYEGKIIGIDTEFDNNLRYYPLLSLVQISTRDHIYIYDALDNGLDPSFIKNVFTDKSVIKVVHSCRQDIEAIWHNLKVNVKSIIDTQIMAEFANFERQIGYGKLVERVFGIELDKSYQYSDWVSRPIPLEKVKYASRDVLFLPFLYQKLKENISLADFEKTMLRIKKIKSDTIKGKDLKRAWIKFRGKYSGQIKQDKQAILRKIFLERESIAEKVNKLPRMVVSDRALMGLASRGVEDLSAFLNNQKSSQLSGSVKSPEPARATSSNKKNRLSEEG